MNIMCFLKLLLTWKKGTSCAVLYHSHTHTHTHARTCMHTHTHTHAHTHTHTHTHAHTHTHTCTLIHMQRDIHFSKELGLLTSCGFDGTVKLWKKIDKEWFHNCKNMLYHWTVLIYIFRSLYIAYLCDWKVYFACQLLLFIHMHVHTSSSAVCNLAIHMHA